MSGIKTLRDFAEDDIKAVERHRIWGGCTLGETAFMAHIPRERVRAIENAILNTVRGDTAEMDMLASGTIARATQIIQRTKRGEERHEPDD